MSRTGWRLPVSGFQSRPCHAVLDIITLISLLQISEIMTSKAEVSTSIAEILQASSQAPRSGDEVWAALLDTLHIQVQEEEDKEEEEKEEKEEEEEKKRNRNNTQA